MEKAKGFSAYSREFGLCLSYAKWWDWSVWSVSLHAHSCEFGLCLSSMSQAFPAMKDGKWPRVFPYITVSLVCVSHTQSGGIGLCGLCLCMHTAVSLVSLIHEPSISCITGCEGNGTITGVISGTFEWKQLCKIDTVPSSGTPSKGSNGARFASLLSLLRRALKRER